MNQELKGSLEREWEDEVAPQVGFEPTTNRLTADRSTTELLRSVEAASMGRRRTSECDG